MAESMEERFQTLQEIVKAARQNLAPGPWDYLIGGAETETTLKRNRQALDSIAWRPRVLRDVSKIDPSSEILGKKIRLPVMLAPVGSLETFEPGVSSKPWARIHAYNLLQVSIGLVISESDTCLVVVTVFKIVAPALCVGGWVRFPPSPPSALASPA